MKKYTSTGDIEKDFFPEKFMKRLEKKLMSYLGLKHEHQKWSSLDEKKKTGRFEFAKPNYNPTKNLKGLSQTIKEFYQKEGYKINESDTGITAQKQGDSYHITLYDGDNYTVFIINQNHL